MVLPYQVLHIVVETYEIVGFLHGLDLTFVFIGQSRLALLVVAFIFDETVLMDIDHI